MPFRCLFHLHTRHSFDSILSPAKILGKAREMQVDVLVVTDHNTMGGAREIQRLAGDEAPLVISAGEYQSEKGDIIGLFLKEEIHSRDSGEIVREIHAQGGLTVLPHPYKAHKLDDEFLAGMDLIETHNSRCSAGENARAAELATSLQRPALAGADAHCMSELGGAVNEFPGEAPRNESELRHSLLHAPRRALTGRVSPLCPAYSQMVKAVKTKDAVLFLSQAKRLAFFVARNGLRESKS